MKVIIGSSIGALVFADLLSRSEEIIWVKRPGKVGGLFGGIDSGSGILDIGMTNLELGSLQQKTDDRELESYSRERTNDCLHHLGTVRSYLYQYSDLVQLPEPQMLYQDELLPDFFYGHRLDILNKFDFDYSEVLKRLAAIPSNLHPSLKYQVSSALNDVSYLKLCRDIYGEGFVNSILIPWMSKLGVKDLATISAIDHRIIWAPLYYPESIERAITEGIVDLGFRASFSKPTESSLSVLIDQIAQIITSRPNVQIHTIDALTDEVIQQYSMCSTSDEIIIADRIPNALLSANQTKIDLLYFKTESRRVEFNYVVNSCNQEMPWYRISKNMNLLEGEIMLCAEYPSNSIKDLTSPHELGIGKYVDTDHFHIEKKLTCISALNLPDRDWDNSYQRLVQKLIESNKNIKLLGPSVGRWKNTFSDQVIQAHKLAKELN